MFERAEAFALERCVIANAAISQELSERWPEFSDQAPTLYAVWGGGVTPAQAFYMVGLILPPKTAAAWHRSYHARGAA